MQQDIFRPQHPRESPPIAHKGQGVPVLHLQQVVCHKTQPSATPGGSRQAGVRGRRQ